MTMRTLSSLGLAASKDVMVTGLAVDSRNVAPGHLFAALPGSTAHGARFAGTAVEQGAAAILTDREGAPMVPKGVPVVVAEDPREALTLAAALWFGAQPEVIAAVTGTNGKTSVTTFLRQIWEARGISGINLGTAGVEGAWTAPTAHTTPEPITLHGLLAEAAGAGVTHCAIEASSHGLDQRRLDGLRLRAAGFTNFSQDHLDYHGTFDAYFAAKMRLFERVLPEDGTACVNIDDAKGLEVAAICRERGQDVLTLGATEGADIRLLATRFEEDGQTVRFDWRGGVHQIRLALVGDFQAANALMAAAMAHASGMEVGEAIEALPGLRTVRGRMQLAAIRRGGGSIFVDYAHTPDAVATALRALRPHAMGRLIAIVGAGGDRDRGKRPLMGRAASDNADAVIVSDDNPRSEDPAAIRAAVLGGAPGAIEIGDRAEAILRGAAMLGPGDVLLIAGKGHETGQEVAGVVHPFDDAEQASLAVHALEEAARG